MDWLAKRNVAQEAARRGWELEETYQDGGFVFRWVGGGEHARVVFSSESEALSWMQQRLIDAPGVSLGSD